MSEIYDLIIIGGGPAGVTAGIYTARKKLKTLIVSKDFQGQLKWAIEISNYPGFEEVKGTNLAKKFEEHLRRQELEVLNGEVIKVKRENQFFEIITRKEKRYISLGIIIASGAEPRSLGVIGEKEFIGRGVTYCAICDAPFFKDKTVAVIGGGNSGVIEAGELTKYAKKVYLLEYQPQLTADELEQERIMANDKISILTSSALKSIEGKNFVERVIYQELKSRERKALKVDGVFVSIGTHPASFFIKELIDRNEKDEIIVDAKTCQTKIPGLFAAGDVTDVKFNQIAVATGEGVKAALSAYEYLRKIKR